MPQFDMVNDRIEADEATVNSTLLLAHVYHSRIRSCVEDAASRKVEDGSEAQLSLSKNTPKSKF